MGVQPPAFSKDHTSEKQVQTHPFATLDPASLRALQGSNDVYMDTSPLDRLAPDGVRLDGLKRIVRFVMPPEHPAFAHFTDTRSATMVVETGQVPITATCVVTYEYFLSGDPGVTVNCRYIYSSEGYSENYVVTPRNDSDDTTTPAIYREGEYNRTDGDGELTDFSGGIITGDFWYPIGPFMLEGGLGGPDQNILHFIEGDGMV